MPITVTIEAHDTKGLQRELRALLDDHPDIDAARAAMMYHLKKGPRFDHLRGVFTCADGEVTVEEMTRYLATPVSSAARLSKV